MTERERLIELLKSDSCESPMLCDPNCKYANLKSCYEERTADYLIENGVIVPLINETDTVYVVLLNKVLKFDIISVNLFQNRLLYKGQHGLNLLHIFRPSDIGKTVFLTREEAEKALKEREQK